jgi:hypothetical protein
MMPMGTSLQALPALLRVPQYTSDAASTCKSKAADMDVATK